MSLSHRGEGRFGGVITAPHRRQQHPHRRLRPGQRRLVRPGRGGHAIADHGDRDRARRGFGRGERHRVLVAGMPQAAVGHAGQPSEVEFDMVAAGGNLAAARFAAAVRADRARRGRGVHRAHWALRHVPGRARFDFGQVGVGRGQPGPAGLAETVRGADRLAAGRAAHAERAAQGSGRHGRVPVIPVTAILLVPVVCPVPDEP